MYNIAHKIAMRLIKVCVEVVNLFSEKEMRSRTFIFGQRCIRKERNQFGNSGFVILKLITMY